MSTDSAQPVRIFVDPLGERYCVRITPHERADARGVTHLLNAVVSETEAGEWVGSVRVYHNLRLEHLTDRDLLELLNQAIGSG